MHLTDISRPLAIAMWDFSWLERRWPGAGYECWDTALDGLKERGYDAVRIDAYPHLLAVDPAREWELLPVWNQQDWGSPARVRAVVQPMLHQFIGKCAERDIKVALSSWFRRDTEDARMRIKTPEDLGAAWRHTLDGIAGAGLADALLYVDLCNEFASHIWSPFFSPGSGDDDRVSRDNERGRRWMADSIATVRAAYPDLDYCFSFISEFDKNQDVSFLDLLELHVFMVMWSDFDERVGYGYELFEPTGYENMVRNAESVYRSDPARWRKALDHGIEQAAEWAGHAGKPLVTTECWGVINYKDWPMLDWDWVKELCEHGVRRACAAGRWKAMATSTFCGPQFAGMWRDVAWHRRMTDLIHAG
jgi:hypothetical protein